MKKNIFEMIKSAIIILLLVSILKVSADTWPKPGSLFTNTNTPINEGVNPQAKAGALVVGSTSSSYPRTGVKLDVLGSLITNSFASTGNTTITGNLNTTDIIISGISATSTPQPLCVDTMGKIILCSSASGTRPIFSVMSPTTTQTWTVPTGVAQAIVELWGGGGSGPGTPPNTNMSVSNGNDGGTSTFSCSGVSLTANGGHKAVITNLVLNTPSTGSYISPTASTAKTNGIGGTYVATGSNIVSTTGSSNGGNGSYTNGSDSYVYSDPDYTSRLFYIFSNGGDSIGGSSGTTQQAISYGFKGLSHKTAVQNNYNFNFPYRVNKGKTPGGGGSSIGGLTLFIDGLNNGLMCSNWSTYTSATCKSYGDDDYNWQYASYRNSADSFLSGFPAGGGGGYIKSVINLIPGQTCSYVIGAGGVANNQNSYHYLTQQTSLDATDGGSGGLVINANTPN